MNKNGILLPIFIYLTINPSFVDAEQQKKPDFSPSASLTLVTDYIGRGISQTDQRPALQVDLTLKHSSDLYFTLWGSNVDFGGIDPAKQELELIAGYAPTLDNGISLDIGFLRYVYPGVDNDLDYDFNEYFAGISYTFKEIKTDIFKDININSYYYYSDDYSGSIKDDEAHYTSLGISAEAFDFATLSLDFGRAFGQAFRHNSMPGSYNHATVALGKSIKGFDVELSYSTTNQDAKKQYNNFADDRFVFSVGRSF